MVFSYNWANLDQMNVLHRVRTGEVADARTPRTAQIGVALLAAAMALLFMLYLGWQLHAMSVTLYAVRDGLDSTNRQVHLTNAGLSETNRLLAGTNARLRFTNAGLAETVLRLGRTNGELTGMAVDLRATVRLLNRTNHHLRAMDGTLRRMNGQISAMTRKITHAKLLF